VATNINKRFLGDKVETEIERGRQYAHSEEVPVVNWKAYICKQTKTFEHQIVTYFCFITRTEFTERRL